MAYQPGVNKIDNEAVLGLNGTYNSLAYRVHEVERHFHGYERWFGLHGSPNGNITAMDFMNQTAPFVLTTGNNNFGGWVCIVGSSDTPKVSGNAFFDLHEMLITGASDAAVYTIQFAWGVDTNARDANVAANKFSTTPSRRATNQDQTAVRTIMMPRVAVGSCVWARAAVVGANEKTISFYIGMHEYEN